MLIMLVATLSYLMALIFYHPYVFTSDQLVHNLTQVHRRTTCTLPCTRTKARESEGRSEERLFAGLLFVVLQVFLWARSHCRSSVYCDLVYVVRVLRTGRIGGCRTKRLDRRIMRLVDVSKPFRHTARREDRILSIETGDAATGISCCGRDGRGEHSHRLALRLQ